MNHPLPTRTVPVCAFCRARLHLCACKSTDIDRVQVPFPEEILVYEDKETDWISVVHETRREEGEVRPNHVLYVRADVAKNNANMMIEGLFDNSVKIEAIETALAAERTKSEAAFRAVTYLLDHAQRNAELFWEIGPLTQAFYLLTLAEAARTGEPHADIEKRRGRCFDKTQRYAEMLREQLDHWQEHGGPPPGEEAEEEPEPPAKPTSWEMLRSAVRSNLRLEGDDHAKDLQTSAVMAGGVAIELVCLERAHGTLRTAHHWHHHIEEVDGHHYVVPSTKDQDR